ncbi:MAG: hypothetical protein ACE5MB_09875, partial [Anaerolineae bacterium]
MEKLWWFLALGFFVGAWLGMPAVAGSLGMPAPPNTSIRLPILNHIGDSTTNVETWIEVQNVGTTFTKAALVLWGEPGLCAPSAQGPLKVECTGKMKPGTVWVFDGLSSGAKSGIVYSVNLDDPEYWCDLFWGTVGDEADWKAAVDEWLEDGVGQPLAVEVWRKGPGDDTPEVMVTASYSGISQEMEGVY